MKNLVENIVTSLVDTPDNVKVNETIGESVIILKSMCQKVMVKGHW